MQKREEIKSFSPILTVLKFNNILTSHSVQRSVHSILLMCLLTCVPLVVNTPAHLSLNLQPSHSGKNPSFQSVIDCMA